MNGETELLASLNSLSIPWSIEEHDAVFTVEESTALHHKIAGVHTKNLFLKDASAQFWLVTAPHDARVDLKALASWIGSKKLSFGKAEDMERLLGVSPGSVTPLAAFNDTEKDVRVVIDARVAAAERVNIHPLRNTATIGVSGNGLLAFLASHNHEAIIVLVPSPQ